MFSVDLTLGSHPIYLLYCQGKHDDSSWWILLLKAKSNGWKSKILTGWSKIFPCRIDEFEKYKDKVKSKWKSNKPSDYSSVAMDEIRQIIQRSSQLYTLCVFVNFSALLVTIFGLSLCYFQCYTNTTGLVYHSRIILLLALQRKVS